MTPRMTKNRVDEENNEGNPEEFAVDAPAVTQILVWVSGGEQPFKSLHNLVWVSLPEHSSGAHGAQSQLDVQEDLHVCDTGATAPQLFASVQLEAV